MQAVVGHPMDHIDLAIAAVQITGSYDAHEM